MLGSHVYRTRAQPQLAAHRPPARVLPRPRSRQEAHARQPLEAPRRRYRGAATCPARRPPRHPRRDLHLRAQPPPRPRRRRARRRQAARPPHRDRPAGQPRPRPDRGPGGRPHHRRAVEAGHRPRACARERGVHAGRVAGTRRRRPARALRRNGLAGGAAGRRRAAPGQAAPGRPHAGALRPHVQLCGGHPLPVGPARAQPRRQAGDAAGRLRAAVHRRGLSGGGRGVRGFDRRPHDGARAGRENTHPLRPPARGAGGRPRDVDRGAHPRRPGRRRGTTLDHHTAGADDPGNWWRLGR